VVSREIRQQVIEAEGRLPDYVVACVGGGSNAIGAFADFIGEPSVALIGVEAGGRGTGVLGEHATRFPGGATGIFEGYKSVFLQGQDGQLATTHSVSAGLDYPGVGPELANLAARGRIQFTSATDAEAVQALRAAARQEGIVPALESAHALAHVLRLAPTLDPDKIIVVNVSGRGDKDIFIIARALGDTAFRDFLTTEASRYGE
jgi:tryptophan synthase beta chain